MQGTRINWLLFFASFLTVLAIIILALSGVLVARHEPDEHESFACSDFNPCTYDFVERLPDKDDDDEHHHHEEDDDDDDEDRDRDRCRRQYQCKHREKATGVCCNKDDYCYHHRDHTRRCFYGQCIGNILNCRGYCVNDTDCAAQAPLPLIVGPGETETACVVNSCVTTIFVQQPTNDPFTLFDLLHHNYTVLQIKSCIVASCFTIIEEGTICFYNWACAPFVGEPDKRRALVETLQTAPSQAPTDVPLINYPFPGPSGANYNTINRRLNGIANALKESNLHHN